MANKLINEQLKDTLYDHIIKLLDEATKPLETAYNCIQVIQGDYETNYDDAKRVTEEMEEKLDYINTAVESVEEILNYIEEVKSNLESFYE